jgi:predicted amidohydrolase YtcJ
MRSRGETPTLILGAEVPGVGVVDVRIRGGVVQQWHPGGLALEADERVIEGNGGLLLPGLHDHHLHLLALAAALRSTRCGPPDVESPQELARALRNASPDPESGWIRGVAYHDSVAGPLDRHALDGFRPDAPLRVQHRSGALWAVNSAGLARLGLEPGSEAPPGVERDASGHFTGRLLRVDEWLRERLPPAAPPDLSAAGALLARCGVTGVTDATPHNGARELSIFSDAVTSGALPQRLRVMGSASLPEPRHALIERGPLKIWLSDAELPDLDTLCERIALAHAQGRGVAIHCVTRGELVLAAAALEATGALAADRIEHASIAPPDLVKLLAGLPVSVVTQPNFIFERGDAYAREVERRDRPWLYRCRGFVDAGVPLGGGTDAPFGVADPWRAMSAAVERLSGTGLELGPRESLSPERALALFTTPLDAPGGTPRQVGPGMPADLCLLDRPWAEARAALADARVVATLCRGELVWPQ